MTNKFSNNEDLKDSELQRLKNVLDIYGAETERWPEADRGELLEIISSNKLAHTLFMEAKTLDQLMNSFPVADVPEGLSHRIIVSVSGTEQMHKPAPHVLQDNVVSLSSYQHESQDVNIGRNIISTTAVMAASLLIGIFIGYSELSPYSLLSGSETDIAVLGSSEQSDISSPLTQPSLEESLSFTEELL